MKLLSRLNLIVAVIFLVFVFLLTDPVGVLNIFVESTGMYFQRFIELGSWSSSFTDNTWQGDWTIFYWAWWIAWSPFVGMFIARVSRGRTVREFVLGVLFVPTIITFIWMSTFGGSALLLEMDQPGLLSGPIMEDSSTSLFVFLKQFPLPAVTSFYWNLYGLCILCNLIGQWFSCDRQHYFRRKTERTSRTTNFMGLYGRCCSYCTSCRRWVKNHAGRFYLYRNPVFVSCTKST